MLDPRLGAGKEPIAASKHRWRISMKTFVIVGAMAATLLTALAADARPVRPNERWCLNTKEFQSGGAFQCDYATYGQCMASRGSNGDWCMKNPALGSGPRGYYDR
jgi:hypothetical protein